MDNYSNVVPNKQTMLKLISHTQCHVVSGSGWVTMKTMHSYSSKHCGFRDLAFFRVRSEDGFIRSLKVEA